MFQGGEGKMSSPVWQFQMGDPEALNSAGNYLVAFQQSASILTIACTAAAILGQALVARIVRDDFNYY